MATAFWGVQKGNKVLLVKWRDAAGRWIGPRRARACRTLEQARRFAEDMERQAERQRHGLEPLPGDQRLTFAELLDGWWEREGRRRRGASNQDYRGFLEKHLSELRPFILNAATGGTFADQLDALLADKIEGGHLGPQSVNHLRSGVFRMFEFARDPKRRLWTTENPVRWIKRRKVPKRRYETLRREEVAPVLAAFSEPGLGAPWRWAALSVSTPARAPARRWDSGRKTSTKRAGPS